MLDNNSADVYLWQEGTHVDGEEKLYGKVLKLPWVKERSREGDVGFIYT